MQRLSRSGVDRRYVAPLAVVWMMLYCACDSGDVCLEAAIAYNEKLVECGRKEIEYDGEELCTEELAEVVECQRKKCWEEASCAAIGGTSSPEGAALSECYDKCLAYH